MTRMATGELEIEYEIFGEPEGPPLLLVMGLNGQLIDWPTEVVDAYVARGFRVIVFDNRDAGLSTEFVSLGVPDLAAIVKGDGQAPYLLNTMAADAFALLDGLGIRTAHVLGASMGSMIAQQMAIEAPERVESLVLAMSSAGNPFDADTQDAFVAMSPELLDRDLVIEGNIVQFKASGSPAIQLVSDETARLNATRRFDRSYRPVGAMRQVAAILASPDRSKELTELDVPTLVLHGEDDPLINVAEGRKVAELIPNARLVVAADRGHQLIWLAEQAHADAVSRLASARAPDSSNTKKDAVD